jgi:hypothetical protein
LNIGVCDQSQFDEPVLHSPQDFVELMSTFSPLVLRLLGVIKRLGFHPMFYMALLLHWWLLQMPMPESAPVVEEVPEEPESVQIAKTAPVTTKKPKTNLDKETPPPKPKPKPVVIPQTQAPQPVPPPPKPSPVPEQPVPSATPSPEPTAENSPPPDSAAEPTSEPDDPNARVIENKDLEAFADLTKEFGGPSEEQAVSFDTSLLPQPELIFTPESLQAYNAQVGELEYQPTAFRADWWKQQPKDKAYEKLESKFVGGTINPIGEYAGGDLYEIKKGTKTLYASLIIPPKRTQRSSTVFVIWARNPLVPS